MFRYCIKSRAYGPHNKIDKLKNNNISKKIDPNSPFAALSSLIKEKGQI